MEILFRTANKALATVTLGSFHSHSIHFHKVFVFLEKYLTIIPLRQIARSAKMKLRAYIRGHIVTSNFDRDREINAQALFSPAHQTFAL